MDGLDEIVREFLVESNEGLDQVERDLVQLERTPGSAELVARVFRAIHTVKGTSGCLGFPQVEALAHVGEDLLSRVRDGLICLSSEMATALLAMVDALRQMLASIENTGDEGQHDYADLQIRLKELSAGNNAPERSATEQFRVEPGYEPIITAAEEQSVVPSETLDTKLDSRVGGGDANVSSVSGNNIRVDLTSLDKMMNLVGELVLARNRVLQLAPARSDSLFVHAAQALDHITTELQESVMKMRLQPIGNVWSKFPRVVRDVALACGKQVSVQLDGSETELDKSIIEAIKDPLMHIVRNAVDHGIELPHVREAAGKPAQGRLVLRAFHEGGQVIIEVADDGAGVDLERVRQKAISRGLIGEDAAMRMGERELVNLLSVPGFSTANTVSNISGRGVGMDVVRTNVEKIGGTVDMQSEAGQGTTVRLKIPLTLAIVPALLVTTNGERFAIPQANLLELVRLKEDNEGIEDVYGAPVYRLRGNLLPLVHLGRELALTDDDYERASHIVVLHADGKQFGLLVDTVQDTEEIVVKPLGKHLKAIPVFAGSTVLGDGHLALILDVVGIAQRANVLSAMSKGQTASAEIAKSDARGRQSWLTFRVRGGEHAAVLLSQVSRLEEIKASAMERIGGHDVVQYRGRIMPIINLSATAVGSDTESEEMLSVVVYASGGRTLGLMVDEILDIVDENVVLEHEPSSAGVLGAAVLNHRVTNVVDLPALGSAVAFGD